MKPVVAGVRELEEAILTLRAVADVMDDPGSRASTRCRHDQGYVRQFASNGAGDEPQFFVRWAGLSKGLVLSI
jgi:hypothetical protein